MLSPDQTTVLFVSAIWILYGLLAASNTRLSKGLENPFDRKVLTVVFVATAPFVLLLRLVYGAFIKNYRFED